MLLPSKAMRMIREKGLKTSITPITKQPTLPQQTKHHWNNADQLEFPDHSLKPSFNPSHGHGHSHQHLALSLSARLLALFRTQNKTLNESHLRQALIIKIAKIAPFTFIASGEPVEGCCSASCKKYFFDEQLCGPQTVQARGDKRKTMSFQMFFGLRTCCRDRYARELPPCFAIFDRDHVKSLAHRMGIFMRLIMCLDIGEGDRLIIKSRMCDSS